MGLPTNLTVNEGDWVSINCSYPNATAITWEREGGAAITDATAGFSVVGDPDPESSTLVISSANHTQHHGSYVCVATLEGGMEEMESFNITVRCESSTQHDILPHYTAHYHGVVKKWTLY